MGLREDWETEVEFILRNENIQVESRDHGCFHLLFIAGNELLINLISLNQSVTAEQLLLLQEEYHLKQIQVIQLWEDVWIAKKDQVLSRIHSMLGLNKRIHGRSTTVGKVSKADAALFLQQYHLQGSVNARYCYGLYFKEELVALATFSNKRRMKQRGENYSSAELIRFATKEGLTVVGGMSKLIKYYAKLYGPDDLMTYADRDWSLGNGYTSAGFKLVAVTDPIFMFVNPTLGKRYVQGDNQLNRKEPNEITVFNTGNLKYILDF